jgi:hypothetical protein
LTIFFIVTPPAEEVYNGIKQEHHPGKAQAAGITGTAKFHRYPVKSTGGIRIPT